MRIFDVYWMRPVYTSTGGKINHEYYTITGGSKSITKDNPIITMQMEPRIKSKKSLMNLYGMWPKGIDPKKANEYLNRKKCAQ